MHKPVVLPQLGTQSATLSVWFAEPGDRVYAGERLVEILADGATFDVSSPATGQLVDRKAFPKDSLEPGQILGVVDSEEGEP